MIPSSSFSSSQTSPLFLSRSFENETVLCHLLSLLLSCLSTTGIHFLCVTLFFLINRSSCHRLLVLFFFRTIMPIYSFGRPLFLLSFSTAVVLRLEFLSWRKIGEVLVVIRVTFKGKVIVFSITISMYDFGMNVFLLHNHFVMCIPMLMFSSTSIIASLPWVSIQDRECECLFGVCVCISGWICLFFLTPPGIPFQYFHKDTLFWIVMPTIEEKIRCLQLRKWHHFSHFCLNPCHLVLWLYHSFSEIAMTIAILEEGALTWMK